MNAKAEGERAGFTGLDHGDAAVFSLDFTIERVASGRFDPSDIAVFLCRGVLPNGEVGKFGEIPADGGGEGTVRIGEEGESITFSIGLGFE